MIKVPRLKTNQHGTYSLRLVWRDKTGKRCEKVQSLGTKEASVARVLALKFNEVLERQKLTTGETMTKKSDLWADLRASITREYKLDIANGVMEANSPADHARMMDALKAYQSTSTAISWQPKGHAPRIVPNSKPFSEVVNLYLEEKTLDNNATTRKNKARVFADFQAIFGDLEINMYRKGEVVQWKNNDIKRGLTAVSINARLGKLNDLFKWAINNGYYTADGESPADDLRIGKNSKLAAKYESYEPFSNDELNSIFATGYLKKFHKPDFFWLPLVALFTGARREEIAALNAADIKTVDGVECIHIQKGKTADARRLVPIHPQLISLGFIDYARHIQSLNEQFLFPHLVQTDNGKGKNAGRQFSDYLDEIGLSDKRKVFHSFRHTVITRLHATGANPAHIMQITGHANETQGVHFQTYTHDLGLKALAETMAKLSYPVNLDPLKLGDPTFAEWLTKWKEQEAKRAKTLERLRKHQEAAKRFKRV